MQKKKKELSEKYKRINKKRQNIFVVKHHNYDKIQK